MDSAKPKKRVYNNIFVVEKVGGLALSQLSGNVLYGPCIEKNIAKNRPKFLDFTREYRVTENSKQKN